MKIFRNAVMFVFAIMAISVVGCGNQNNTDYPYLRIHQAQLQPTSTIAPVGAVMAFSNMVVNYCGDNDYVNIIMTIRADTTSSKAIVQPLLIEKPQKAMNDSMSIKIVGSGAIFPITEGNMASHSYLFFTLYRDQMCKDIEFTLAGGVQRYSEENPGQNITMDIVNIDIMYSAYDTNIKVFADMPILGVFHTTTAAPFYDSWK